MVEGFGGFHGEGTYALGTINHLSIITDLVGLKLWQVDEGYLLVVNGGGGFLVGLALPFKVMLSSGSKYVKTPGIDLLCEFK